MARAMRGTSRLLVVVTYGTGCGGGGSCVGIGRYVCRSQEFMIIALYIHQKRCYYQRSYGPRDAGHGTAIGRWSTWYWLWWWCRLCWSGQVRECKLGHSYFYIYGYDIYQKPCYHEQPYGPRVEGHVTAIGRYSLWHSWCWCWWQLDEIRQART